ncbi:hypothetical protein SCARR_04101 [Pontiella sulfatireligans]|uniref:Uncharacterized protein n=1 Tax=Pontiella sulfatireligans TaxID=2750658 RepID=A0A6C2UNZ9_9BACT|nr:hypothetical protein SCARR_04101 [Pontiella sulfatireligans]
MTGISIYFEEIHFRGESAATAWVFIWKYEKAYVEWLVST